MNAAHYRTGAQGFNVAARFACRLEIPESLSTPFEDPPHKGISPNRMLRPRFLKISRLVSASMKSSAAVLYLTVSLINPGIPLTNAIASF